MFRMIASIFNRDMTPKAKTPKAKDPKAEAPTDSNQINILYLINVIRQSKPMYADLMEKFSNNFPYDGRIVYPLLEHYGEDMTPDFYRFVIQLVQTQPNVHSKLIQFILYNFELSKPAFSLYQYTMKQTGSDFASFLDIVEQYKDKEAFDTLDFFMRTFLPLCADYKKWLKVIEFFCEYKYSIEDLKAWFSVNYSIERLGFIYAFSDLYQINPIDEFPELNTFPDTVLSVILSLLSKEIPFASIKKCTEGGLLDTLGVLVAEFELKEAFMLDFCLKNPPFVQFAKVHGLKAHMPFLIPLCIEHNFLLPVFQDPFPYDIGLFLEVLCFASKYRWVERIVPLFPAFKLPIPYHHDDFIEILNLVSTEGGLERIEHVFEYARAKPEFLKKFITNFFCLKDMPLASPIKFANIDFTLPSGLQFRILKGHILHRHSYAYFDFLQRKGLNTLTVMDPQSLDKLIAEFQKRAPALDKDTYTSADGTEYKVVVESSGDVKVIKTIYALSNAVNWSMEEITIIERWIKP